MSVNHSARRTDRCARPERGRRVWFTPRARLKRDGRSRDPRSHGPSVQPRGPDRGWHVYSRHAVWSQGVPCTCRTSGIRQRWYRWLCLRCRDLAATPCNGSKCRRIPGEVALCPWHQDPAHDAVEDVERHRSSSVVEDRRYAAIHRHAVFPRACLDGRCFQFWRSNERATMPYRCVV